MVKLARWLAACCLVLAFVACTSGPDPHDESGSHHDPIIAGTLATGAQLEQLKNVHIAIKQSG